jgi:RNA polymerase sigma factor (sigma-70 family)
VQTSALRFVLDHVRRQAGADAVKDLSDAELLERFCGRREEAAFALLLQRHGPTVLGVCRRVLRDTHAAEDAFQTTFLILVQKAGAVRKRQALGSFLYGVAYRVAARARSQAEQPARQGPTIPAAENEMGALDELARAEALAVLDEEIGCLPDKYRRPLILCYLEGKTHEQAAREMAWPKSSVPARLKRGCELLRQRLTRRGITLPAAALAVLLADRSASAVPALLTLSTVRSAVQALAGSAVPGTTAVRWSVLLVLLLTAGLAVAGVSVLASPHEQPKAEPPPQAAQPAEQPKEQRVVATRTDQNGDALPADAVARIGAVRFQHSTSVNSVAFSPDGKLVATGSAHGELRVWDAATGKIVQRCIGPYGSVFQCIAFSPDGKYLVSDKDGGGLWEVATGKKLWRVTFDHAGAVHTLEFSPDGKTIAVGCSVRNTIYLCDAATGQMTRKIEGHTDGVPLVAFGKDGKTLVSGSTDKTARIWDLATDKEVKRFQEQSAVTGLALSPDGKLLATRTEKSVRLWEIASGKELRSIKVDPLRLIDPNDMAFSPDSKSLAANATLWDVATGKESVHFEMSGWAIAFAPDGKTAVHGGYDGAVRISDVATGNILRPPLTPTIVRRFSLPPSPPMARS